MDFLLKDGSMKISNFKNISNAPGYDSQPSFYDLNNIIFSGIRDGNTDIRAYNMPSGQSWWLNLPTDGGEYSPMVIPGERNVSAVRLDADGLQRLYRYPMPEKPSELMIEGLQVAYYNYASKDVLIASVLSGSQLDLVRHDFTTNRTDTLLTHAGRSIHRVPDSEFMSYTSQNEDKNWDIYQLDIKTGESFFVAQLPVGIQDHIWLDDSKLLCGSGAKLYLYDFFGSANWVETADLSIHKLKDITRLALSLDGKKITLVAESLAETPVQVVQRQLERYNARDLEGFLATYSEDIELYNFPDIQISTGRDALRKNYSSFFDETPDLHCEIKNRITIGNKVIDEEYITMNGQHFSAIAIYEVNNGEITKVTFVR